ncbi:unnamed protein product [Bursaphelenchus okinawaensis]|uniref:Sodium/hydrogen exchanger n=1 Tax=Bursaphelenchus okinawaensis TaxID=465554 RepID=A0A811KN39_9BILA|nr:unnamed protein product [Bursaphelenchus okinawaensis]CAG9106470.1 unnamed protein product [Bursaphelenchus okinawaensis]
MKPKNVLLSTIFLLLQLQYAYSQSNNNKTLKLEQILNKTEATTERPHLSVINFNFHHAELPLFLSAAAVGIIIFKSLYYAFPHLKGIIPDSSMMLIAGIVVGGCLHWFFPDREFRLEPTWFFWGMLPMIILDAGYFVPTKDFVNNIGAITSFAVFGTLMNIFLTGTLLYIINGYFSLFVTPMSVTDILIFSTLISAVDPVAVISVFEEIHVNRQLYILVFGESLLNDATTIVFYHTFQQFSTIGAENIVPMDILRCIASFSIVSFGGILTGIIFGGLTGLLTKLTRDVELYQPLTCLLLPYFAYSAAEAVGVSGVLALMFCGLTMKNYLAVNVKDSSLVSFNYMLKTLSSFCETMIFVMLGVSAVSRNHVFDFWFIIATLFACFIFRFITIYSMTYFLNKAREEAISLVDQFVIAYGGIRGAVCYGLVVALDKDVVGARDMFTTTTVSIILFTSLVQGGTVKCLVNKLKVKHAEPEEETTLFELVMNETATNLMEGISAIAFVQPEKKYKVYWRRVSSFLNRHLMVDGQEYNSKCRKIVAHSQQIMISEAVSQIKKFGSYRLLPSYPSMNTMNTSKSVPANMNEHAEEMNDISLMVPQPENMVRIKLDDVDGMGDRKKSLRTIFKGAVAEIPEEKPQMYSRHFMHDPRHFPYDRPLTPLFESEEDEDPDGSKNYLTFPNTERDFFEMNTFSVPLRKRLNSETTRPSILPGQPTRPRFEVKMVRNRQASKRRRNSSTGPDTERLMINAQPGTRHDSLRRGSTPARHLHPTGHRPKVKFAIEGDSP